MNLIYPAIRLRSLPGMLLAAVAGAAVAGVYGVIHDQITYSLSPEYFTRLKFDQFAWADLGFPPRVFAGLIGFLATWWVGLFAGWFLARSVPASVPTGIRRRAIAGGFGTIILVALPGAVAGWGLAALGCYDHHLWEWYAASLGVEDVRAFVRVGYIHNGSYLGGLAGLVIAIIRVRRIR